MLHVSDLTIVQHNDLIGSSYRLDIDEMRLLNLALTKVDSRNKNEKVITLYPDEFRNMYGLEKKNIWRNMKKATQAIMRKPITLNIESASGKCDILEFHWLEESLYSHSDEDSSFIKIIFSKKIAPYLFELQGNFTKINFEYAARLTSPFSFRLYQWIVREHRIKKGQYYELTMTLSDIKKSAQLALSYTRWEGFKRRVITPAIEAINQRTNLSVSYTVTKKGNKVHSLTFTYIDEMQKAISAESKGENFTFAEQKPMRPRLLRRPKVKKDSHEEGEWQKANFKKLSLYQEQLKAWDKVARLTIPDLKKLIEYSRLFGIETHKEAVEELSTRQKK